MLNFKMDKLSFPEIISTHNDNKAMAYRSQSKNEIVDFERGEEGGKNEIYSPQLSCGLQYKIARSTYVFHVDDSKSEVNFLRNYFFVKKWRKLRNYEVELGHNGI